MPDLTNHHNALACPYCNPNNESLARQPVNQSIKAANEHFVNDHIMSRKVVDDNAKRYEGMLREEILQQRHWAAKLGMIYDATGGDWVRLQEVITDMRLRALRLERILDK